jgi:predicted dehydrogenase
MKRRKFLKSAASAGAALTILPRYVLGGTGSPAPSDQLTKAVIGVGGMGQWHAFYAPGKLLAVCDVDKNHLQRTLDQAGPDVKGYNDYRELLKRDDIDIVHIATPPHWHGRMSRDAAAAGKDIWCEKPMTRTIGEGQKLVRAVQSNGRIFRVNTWFRFEEDFYGFGTAVEEIKKVIESGMLGWPLKVTVSGSTGFHWKFYWSGRSELAPQWIPEELDYDFWLGPAPYKAYHPHRVHGTFRGYWDYDGGGLGDMGQHYLDPVQYLLEKDHTSPIEIEAEAPQAHHDAVGSWKRIYMKYADGCEIILDGESVGERVPFIEGPDGKLFPGLKSDIPDFEQKYAVLPEPEPMVTDFHKAVRERRKFALNEENGHRSTTLVNLAKIAIRTGRKLYFDPENQRFIGDEAANRFIHQPMRAPWQM